MVLVRSPDLNNVKIGQGQLQRVIKHSFTIYGGCSHFGQVTSNNLYEYSIKQPSDS